MISQQNNTILNSCLVVCCALAFASSAMGAEKSDSEKIDFNRDVRPILSNNCFVCHGKDKGSREAELRLDNFESAISELPSGSHAFVPGNLGESEAYQRMISTDEYEIMPPSDSEKKLTEKEIAILKQWIEEGAEYQDHWAFAAASSPAIPSVKQKNWMKNPMDAFVLAKLEKQNLSPQQEASRETLLRRVTLDLTGLPPALVEMEAFKTDLSSTAYEKVVNRLLASPRYGEHQARFWLDLARYGDTHGLHGDFYREIWPYRDWVIRAFNTNMPYDKFTIDQLAGDLVPNGTEDQKVATGFLRCHVTTDEDGIIKEEVYVRYIIDRVETVSTAYLGLTTGCAVCHDHKFDPISQKEFYQLFAFFNNGTDKAMDGNVKDPPPVLMQPNSEQKIQRHNYEQGIEELQAKIKSFADPNNYKDPFQDREFNLEEQEIVWVDDMLPQHHSPKKDAIYGWNFVSASSHQIYSGKKSTFLKSRKVSQNLFQGAKKGLHVGEGDRFFFYVYLDPADPPKQIMLKVNNGSWDHRAFWGQDLIKHGKINTSARMRIGKLPNTGEWVRLEADSKQLGIKTGDIIQGIAFSQVGGAAYYDSAGVVTRFPQDGSELESFKVWDALQKAYSNSTLSKDLQQRQNDFLQNVYTGPDNIVPALQKQQQEVEDKLESLKEAIPTTLVMQERNDIRPAYLLKSGQYDQRGEEVVRAVPAMLPQLPQGSKADRYAFAKWLLDPQHPLTARVTVNRIWQQYFGIGIVKTSEDFGIQGELPSHPKLLDYLATEFIATGWDVKALHKTIVMSATYRQDSKAPPNLVQEDPENRLLARGPRFRLDAEVIRDSALAMSGLLHQQVGGPPVKPYQPAGVWKAVSTPTSNTAVFKQDHGAALYRRSVYTFWKRTAPPPSLQAFDAPTRETCSARRSRTNTPIAALVLMNDTQYVEAARKMAERILKADADDDVLKIHYAFQLATTRVPTTSEIQIVQDMLKYLREKYVSKPLAAKQLIETGESTSDDSLDLTERASWTVICNLMMNLSETITKN